MASSHGKTRSYWELPTVPIANVLISLQTFEIVCTHMELIRKHGFDESHIPIIRKLSFVHRESPDRQNCLKTRHENQTCSRHHSLFNNLSKNRGPRIKAIRNCRCWCRWSLSGNHTLILPWHLENEWGKFTKLKNNKERKMKWEMTIFADDE